MSKLELLDAKEAHNITAYYSRAKYKIRDNFYRSIYPKLEEYAINEINSSIMAGDFGCMLVIDSMKKIIRAEQLSFDENNCDNNTVQSLDPNVLASMFMKEFSVKARNKGYEVVEGSAMSENTYWIVTWGTE